MRSLEWFAYIIIIVICAVLFVAPSYGEDYDRAKHFGSGWDDFDHDCQDTRQEVLIEESIEEALLSPDGCTVLSGLWFCHYTAAFIRDPRLLDIDHMVPLKEAWISGADKWSFLERYYYANDLSNPNHLIAVSFTANRSKGSKDPARWLPDSDKSRYVRAWLDVKWTYNLDMDDDEYSIIRKYWASDE